jgi:hypothetical protein
VIAHLALLPFVALALAAPAEPPEILVARGLLRERGLSVGGVVMLSADPRGAGARPFRIAGVYEPTPDPSRFTAKRLEARMHLPDLLALAAAPGEPASEDAVGAINVVLKDPADAPAFARELDARAPGVSALPTTAARDEHFVASSRSPSWTGSTAPA